MRNGSFKDAFVERVRKDNEGRKNGDKISIDWMTRKEAEKMKERVLGEYPEADIEITDEHFVVTREPNGDRVMIPRKHKTQQEVPAPETETGVKIVNENIFDRIEKAITKDQLE